MSFQDRKHQADLFEKRLLDRLNQTGWHAYPFGQAQLPDACRVRLRRFEDGSGRPCLIRWMPDVITFRDFSNGRSFVALLDAKSCEDRPNYALEKSAIEAAEIWTDKFYTPTFFVFDDWKVITPREARQRGLTGPTSIHGSGTPYVLVSKQYGRDFNERFPPIIAA